MAHRRITDPVREPPINSRLRYSELGMISSVKGKRGGTSVQFGEPPMQHQSRIYLGTTTFVDLLVGSSKAPIQSVVSFRPLFGSRVASAVCGSVSATCLLVAGRLLTYSVFYCTLASQWQFVDPSCDSPMCCRCCWLFQ
ncbi:hypothetical protein HAX54_045470 [Datura stramonium]|uniref:Uncharacterized protein n=1 Tax=Datura stramonium TaxID=4076 RepID=A0ABS8SS37_DATST|nr:hypothetical protein [Datura stramonium]